MYEDQPDPPFALQIELTQGCNLQCTFCGINAIQDPKNKVFKYMELETLHNILNRLPPWNPRIEFAMHGEPTMHPEWLKFIEETRRMMPAASIMMTSNGGGLLKNTVSTLSTAFDNGLNLFAMDEYQTVKIGQKIRQAFDRDSHMVDFKIGEYPEDKHLSPHQRWPVDARQFIFIEDISVARDGTHSTLNNHAGSGAPLNFSKAGKRCAKPFREIAVRYDGSIAICCNDWLGRYNCGNVNETPLHEIWSGPAFQTARRYLYHGMRDLAPCYGCDAVSYRVGFLPDKKGKEELPKPTKRDKERWEHKVKQKPLVP
jgi:organic radical activating enzyme